MNLEKKMVKVFLYIGTQGKLRSQPLAAMILMDQIVLLNFAEGHPLLISANLLIILITRISNDSLVMISHAP